MIKIEISPMPEITRGPEVKRGSFFTFGQYTEVWIRLDDTFYALTNFGLTRMSGTNDDLTTEYRFTKIRYISIKDAKFGV